MTKLAAVKYNVADVWHVRNSVLWALPIETVSCMCMNAYIILIWSILPVAHVATGCCLQAWHKDEIAILRDPATGRLFMRVLTDELMGETLQDYDT